MIRPSEHVRALLPGEIALPPDKLESIVRVVMMLAQPCRSAAWCDEFAESMEEQLSPAEQSPCLRLVGKVTA